MAKKNLYLAVQDALAKGYRATPGGEVYGPRGRKIGTDQGTGYITIGFQDADGENHTPYAHRFIWMALVGDIPPGYDINHKNKPKSDNSLENLECISHAENMQHAAQMGLGGGGRGVARKKSAEKLEEALSNSRGLLVDLWKALEESRKGVQKTDQEFGAFRERLAEILEIR